LVLTVELFGGPVIIGASGATLSTTTVVGADTLPAGSVAVTLRTVPFGGITEGTQDHVPLAATITGLGVHTSGVPEGSLMMIVLPGVAVPVIGEPSVGLTIGADGVVVAALDTVVLAGLDAVLFGSVAVALITVPVGSGVARLQEYVPEAVTTIGVGVHVITFPLASLRTIVAPGVAVPLITTSVLLIGLIVGVADWVAAVVVSETIVVAGIELFPAGSFAIAEIVVPATSGVAIVQE
jgi:hypothetical protein